MNKHLIVIGMTLMLLAVGLSGCTEQSNVIGDTDKVKITDYEVETNWLNYDNFIFYNKSNFYHNYPLDSYYNYSFHDKAPIVWYSVSGHVMNIAGEFLDVIIVNAKFCDANNKVLAEESETLYDLPDSYTDSFYISLNMSDTKYFDEIENVKFEVLTVL